MPVRAQAKPLRSADHDALVGELHHATHNLLHRMRYWTSLLESERLGDSGAEALNELRLSLDGLQGLVGATMDLLRPSEVRTIAIPAGDILRSVALRFRAAATADALARLAGAATTLVDPAVLDRALAALVEAVHPVTYDHGAAAVVAELRGVAADEDAALAPALAVTVESRGRADGEAGDETVLHADVHLALARKLLAEIGCGCSWSRDRSRVRVEIVLPLEAHRQRAK
jgi:hypothetical protein